MDADLSHSPEDVPRLLQALESADVALGSRHVPGGGVRNWPLSRRLLSQAGSLYARILLRLPLGDVTSGFRAYRAEALSAIDLEALRAKGFSFQIEILRRLLELPGARAQELPIVFRDRAAGVSKLSGGIIAEALLEVLRLSFAEPALVFKEIRSESELPRVTIVVPTREAEAEPEALDALERLDYPRERFEVLVVRGNAPAAERNLAARESQGEILVFLDDDSSASPELLRVYARAFRAWPRLAVAGGPAVPASPTRFGRLRAAVLGEPWVMGRSASRYRALGESRSADERELILCNLAVRRQAFLEAGGFDERLYPNEENELLERFRLKGAGCLYLRDARVERLDRDGFPAYLRSIARYGRGRAEQLRVLPSRSSLLRLAAASLWSCPGFVDSLGLRIP
jgi:glycosyltransferase involved in cell wall biosynthesis